MEIDGDLPSCTIMVLNWNGALWLQKCLPSIILAAHKVNCEVWVIDNNSSDESANVCRNDFPIVRFEAFQSNKVLSAYNIAVKLCDTEIVIFLNNDVTVDEDFISPMLRHFVGNGNIFAVAPCVRTFPPEDNVRIESQAQIPSLTNGMIRSKDFSSASATYTWYTVGGAMICSRSKFIELMGFDELYFPGYFEDIDICWRAWKKNWVCLYEPLSKVYHAGGSSFGRSEGVRTLILRNEYLCHWKNLSSPALIINHILTTLPRLFTALARGDKSRISGFLQALKRMKMMMRSRVKVQSQFSCGDLEIVNRIIGGL